MFLDLIRRRRSIRQYTPQPLAEGQIATLAEAALRAPSSRGLNPWEFVLVTERDTLEQLGKCKPHGASFLAGAALAIAVCADPQRSDVWVEDAAIAATYIQLAAQDLGLGSCWVQVRRRDPAAKLVAGLLALPPNLEVEALVAIGHPAENKRPHPDGSLQREKLWRDRHGRPYPLPAR
jgi:nitroreductase